MIKTTNNKQQGIKPVLSTVTSPFGSDEQNKLCESIFLSKSGVSAQPITKEMLKMAMSVAQKNDANLIQESIKAKNKNEFTFDIEKETDDCSGMEIFQYTAKLDGSVELDKNIFLKYLHSPDTIFSDLDIRELQKAKDDVQGTLNILSAIIEDSDSEDIKTKFEPQRVKIEEQLKKYNNFFETLQSL